MNVKFGIEYNDPYLDITIEGAPFKNIYMQVMNGKNNIEDCTFESGYDTNICYQFSECDYREVFIAKKQS
jgi:hypothetical protein